MGFLIPTPREAITTCVVLFMTVFAWGTCQRARTRNTLRAQLYTQDCLYMLRHAYTPADTQAVLALRPLNDYRYPTPCRKYVEDSL